MRTTPMLCLFPVLLAVASPAVPAPDGTVRLAPHRAVYDLTLAASRGARTLESARGRIVFELGGDACEGFTTKFRQVTELSSAETGTKLTDLRSTSFESGDGRTLRFHNDQVGEGTPVQTVDGTADRKDGKLAVRLRTPKRESFDLDGGAVFPNTQMRDLVVAAREGRSTMPEKIFDGSEDGRKVYETLAVIGKRREPGSGEGLEEAARQDGLARLARWPVTISYFPLGRPDGTPVYTLSFDLYENGVSRALRLDYGDFALAGTMNRLDLLPESSCRR